MKCQYSFELPHRALCAVNTWLCIIILFSTTRNSVAQITSVSISEQNNAQIRINTNIVFTCRVTMNERSLVAMNLEYMPPSDQSKVCMSWVRLENGVPNVKKSLEDCAPPRSTLIELVSDTEVRFTLNDARLADEKRFFCQGFATFSEKEASSFLPIIVSVPPLEPTISLSDGGTLIEGEPLTITCTANTGKPEGSIFWFKTDSTPGSTETPLSMDTSNRLVQSNGTVVITETLPRITALKVSDNGVKYRCAAQNAALLPNEEPPSSEITLSVQYGIKSVTVTPSGVQGQNQDNVPFFYPDSGAQVVCSGAGNPQPTFSWTKLSGPGNLVTDAGTLSIRSVEETALGMYEYRCVGSNTVDGVPNLQSRNYSFIIEAKPTDPPTTPAPVTTVDPNGGNTGGSTEPINTAGLAGGLAGVVIAILILVAIVFCVCRRKKKGMLDEETETGKSKNHGIDGPRGGYDIQLDDGPPYSNYEKSNGGAFPIDSVDNTPGSRRGFHVPGEPSYDPAYM